MQLEQARSVPVNINSSPEISVRGFNEACSSTSGKQQNANSEESCEVMDTSVGAAADQVKHSYRNQVGIPHGQNQTPSTQRPAKIVTFNLEDDEQKNQAVTTHDEDDDREERVQEVHIEENTTFEGQEVEEEDEEDFDLVFPEEYHSDEAYQNLLLVDEVLS